MVNIITPETSLLTSIFLIIFAILVAVVVGLCGLFNGFAVAHIGIPPILVTVGTMQLFMGIAIIITKGQAIEAAGV